MKNSFFLVIPKQQSSPQRLIEFEEKYLQQWIEGLPAANPGMSTRLIYDLISEMNTLIMPCQLRLDSLELLRARVLEMEDYLRSKLIKTDFPKEENDHKALKLLVALQRQFAIGYWITVKDFTGTDIGWFKGKYVALAIQRCMKGLSSILISHYLMALPIPDWIWLDLHSLYRLSVKTKTNVVQVNSGPNSHAFQKVDSPEESYLQIVMLSLASPFGLMQKEIQQVYFFCGIMCALVKLKSKPVSNQLDQCLLLTEEDKPPFFQNQLDESKRRELASHHGLAALYVDLTKLYQAIETKKLAASDTQPRFATRHERLDAKISVSEDLFAYLRLRWSGMALQSDDLFGDRLDRYIAIGLSASYRLQKKTKDEQAVDTEYVARSVSGQLLSVLFDKPNLLSVGGLISIRKADVAISRRALGVVNQLMLEKEKLQVIFGISLLADQYLPVDYRCKMGRDTYEHQGNALLCKQEEQKGKNFLIMDNFLFKEGDKLNLQVNQNEISVLLKQKTNIALGYWQFECVRLVEADEHY